jgi:DMSO/TMAO reductase YedYZ molybdopterin-dependent catalytic subunit
VTLPPGQHALDHFPRFGTHLHRPPPPIPADPAIAITGLLLTESATVPLRDLHDLPRRTQRADFHCVAGWSATGLEWEGVPFAAFWREHIEPRLRPGATVNHLAFYGHDRYRSIVTLEDALGDDVLIAEQLDGRPLDADHGAPVRLVSPSQYGYMSTKHLCRIEPLERAPSGNHPSPLIGWPLRLLAPHERARVWEEERHAVLPARALRTFYWRVLYPPIRVVCRLGSRDTRP